MSARFSDLQKSINDLQLTMKLLTYTCEGGLGEPETEPACRLDKEHQARAMLGIARESRDPTVIEDVIAEVESIFPACDIDVTTGILPLGSLGQRERLDEGDAGTSHRGNCSRSSGASDEGQLAWVNHSGHVPSISASWSPEQQARELFNSAWESGDPSFINDVIAAADSTLPTYDADVAKGIVSSASSAQQQGSSIRCLPSRTHWTSSC